MEKNDDIECVPALLEIGLRLKSARESRRWSLEKLSEKTRVSVRYLTRIEEGRFSEIPSRTLVLGFTKAVCQALKIKPDEILATLKRELYNEGKDDLESQSTSEAPRRRWFRFWR